MEEDFYGGDQPEPVAPEAEPQAQEESVSESETILANDSFFPAECKVGDTYKVRVIAQYDGEKELELVKEDAVEEEDHSMDTAIQRVAEEEAEAV